MIRPVLFSSVVKGMYHFTGLVIEVFQFLLMVLDMKLQQSVVCTGMALDRGGLATYNRFTGAALYKGGALHDHRFYQVASPGRWDVSNRVLVALG
ncbi:hypothetical protein DVQ40_20340 [Yersinia enterocolitica]|nr:hypothetical protein FORC2_3998 [Yersinia enterocolitica]ALG43283.1 hypothetical protein LI89_00500 [Yersinia enterocolitica]EKN4924875.1 hypothetical protein [Yersinia enterocolitica]EKN5044100.1 hypothetical protein [Yersinia enterocolitica]EKN5932427.1 hypothetical protein [Yersinia enterocolitica]